MCENSVQKDKVFLEGEEKYWQLFNQMLNGFALHEIICDDQGQPIDYRFLDVNPAFERMIGLKAESIVGRTVLEVLPQTELSWIEKYGKVALTGETIHFEDFSSQINRYFEVTAFCTGHNQFACSFSDITERKTAEANLKKAFDIINRSPAVAFLWKNAEGWPVEFVTDNVEILFGYTAEELTSGKVPYSETVHPVDLPRVVEEVTTYSKEEGMSVFNHEPYRIITKAGKTKWIYDSTVIKRNKKGDITHYQGILLDITRRKLAEEELRESEKRHKLLFENAADAMFIVDCETRKLVDCNEKAEELTGRKRKEILSMTADQLHPQEVLNKTMDVFEKQATGEKILIESSVLTKKGVRVPVSISTAILRLGGKPNIVGIFHDMTEMKKLENFIQKSHKLESIGILAGGIAHDFNNILGAIFGYIELGIEETTEPLVQTYLSKSISSIDRARALTQQLLTFSKGGEPIKKVGNLFPFVQETAQFALSGSTVSCRFQIQENLWPCDFDKNQIGQIVDNLIINAQQAMPNGGMIEVSAWNLSLLAKDQNMLAAGNYVKLSIKDQGIGIPKEFLPSIFDPYYTTKSKGHGLGLSTCYSIVNRHGGGVDVESELGKGSTFHVYLPSAIEPVSTITEESVMTHTGCGTFLVMDDEESICDLLKIILESFGYTVVLKENGKDAIDFFAKELQANRKFAGMIFDLTIPGGMGGKEAIEEIRKICSNTAVFVSSGYSSDPIMANPEKYGFNASLCKPFMKTQLVEMLEKHLKKHK